MTPRRTVPVRLVRIRAKLVRELGGPNVCRCRCLRAKDSSQRVRRHAVPVHAMARVVLTTNSHVGRQMARTPVLCYRLDSNAPRGAIIVVY
eukprot:scaffold23310_cov75-Phaeocystis_antarctica.AAC.8